jgi:DNA-binding transcriptional MerR regulator
MIALRSAQLALERLEELGLITSERDGNRRYYRAVRSERFEALRELLARELGVADIIRRNLSALEDRIDWAFLFGSAARSMRSAIARTASRRSWPRQPLPECDPGPAARRRDRRSR